MKQSECQRNHKARCEVHCVCGLITGVVAMLFAICANVALGDITIKFEMGGPDKKVGGWAGTFLRWDDPKIVPHIEPKESTNGRMDVEENDKFTKLLFYHNGDEKPHREYLLIPGEKVFASKEFYLGKLYAITTWTYEDDGSVTMDKCDADGKTLFRHNRLSRDSDDGSRSYVREKIGDVITEKEYENIPGHGGFVVFESSGTGDNRRWTRKIPYYDGWAICRPHTELDSSGNWTIYEYEPFGRVRETTNSESKVTRSRLTRTTKTITGNSSVAKAITNETGLVTAWKGSAIVTETSYKGHEPEDDTDTGDGDDYLQLWEPRTTYVYELTDEGKVTPVKRYYYAEFIRNGDRWVIEEQAKTPDAHYGADGNERWTRVYHWRNRFAGRLKWQIDPEGEMQVFAVDFYEVDGVRLWITESYATTPDRPWATPYETVSTRRFEDAKKRLMREEHWIELENGGKELLDWTDYERDKDGRVIRETSSSGKMHETKWHHGNVVERKDSTGNVAQYEYDAINRMTRSETAIAEENMRYDYASQLTNVFGSVYGRKHEVSLHYNDAGAFTDAASDVGETYKTVNDKDGSKKTYVNGKLAWTHVDLGPGESIIYQGPKGKDSPRWRKTKWDANGNYCLESFPKVGGGVAVKTNELRTAEISRDVKRKQAVRYSKKRGYWWKETLGEDGSKVFRRVSGTVDGSEDTIFVDTEGRERRVVVTVDRDAAEMVRTVTRPESTLPHITVYTNSEVVLDVSFSGVTNRYERGLQERVQAVYDGRGGVMRYEYDGKGRRIGVVDRCGRMTRYEYDGNGRVAAIITDGEPKHEFRYDSEGNVVEEKYGDGFQRKTYDEYGDLVRTECALGGKSFSIEYLRDEATGLTTNIVSNGESVEYRYDDYCELASVNGVDIKSYECAFTNALEIAHDEFAREIGYSVCGKKKLARAFDPTTGRMSAFNAGGIKGEAKISYLSGTDLIESIEYPSSVVARFEYDAEGDILKLTYSGLKDGVMTFVPEKKSVFDEKAGYVRRLRNMYLRKPLADDKMIYLDFDSGFSRPVAMECDDGRVRWCILDTSSEVKGVFE